MSGKYKYANWHEDPMGHPQTAEQAELREACRSSLKFLCKEMLGYNKWDDGLHDDIANYLEVSGSHKLILIPRGHLKTSIVTIGWVIQQVLRNPDIRVLIRNAVWDKARVNLGAIQAYLEDGALPMLFGRFKNQKSYWTKDGCTLTHRKSKVVREPTFTTAGLETSLTGYHFDLIVDDDLVDQANSATKEQIQKVINVYNDSFNLLDRGGTHVVVGTRWNLRDLYGHVIGTDLGTVNGLKLNPDEGVDGWRKTYNQWVTMRK
jgi:hypothetical protein